MFRPLLLIALALPIIGISYAEQVHLIQHADIAELIMHEYQLNFDGNDYTIFFRFTTGQGSDESSEEDILSKVSSITIDKQRKSLNISVKNVEQTDIFSLQFPQKLIPSQSKDLTVLVDGKKKPFESNVQGVKRTMIFILPAKSSKIEIIGTQVIPEFQSGMFAFTVVMLSLLVSFFVWRLKIFKPSFQY